jgi:hypothetical protein
MVEVLNTQLLRVSSKTSSSLTFALEGVGTTFKLADFDQLSLSNLNRLRAGLHQIGVAKTTLAARELFELDPYLDISVFSEGLRDDNMDAFLLEGGKLDLLVEECDDQGAHSRGRVGGTMSTSHQIDHKGARSVIRGVLRLESVDSYDLVFGPARTCLTLPEASYTLDVSGVSLMNSSGIRALANLVLLAKQHGTTLVIVGSQAVAWQRKTMASLSPLYDRLEIQLA